MLPKTFDRQRLVKSEIPGCLCAILGSLIGLFLSGRTFAAYAAQVRETRPGYGVCGLPAFAGMVWGAIFGGLFGLIFAKVLYYLLIPRIELRKLNGDRNDTESEY